MRHLPLLTALCITLAACASPAAPQAPVSFTLERGQGVQAAPGVMLTLDAVDDSRCPAGVRCVWAGKLSYRFSIRRGGAAPERFTLAPGQPGATPAALPGRRVVLDDSTLPPPPAPGTTPNYRVTIRIVPA